MNVETPMSKALRDSRSHVSTDGTFQQQAFPALPPDESSCGWDKLTVDGKARKEKIFLEHFPKAFERFNAGVGLTKIRKHFAALGANFSPATFRKRWDEAVKKQAGQL